jgi:hypothetical protein
MREIPLRVTPDEFAALNRLAGTVWGAPEPPPPPYPDRREEEWEAGLREILGDVRVDAMKRLAAQAPLTFALDVGPFPRGE